MSLVLDEFYNQVPHIGVSSIMGKGFDKIMPQAEELKKEYYKVFLPELTGKNRGGANEEEQEEEQKSEAALNLIKGQAMPMGSVGPDKVTLITQNV